LVLNVIVRVFDIKSIDELSQFLFFSLHIDVIGLEVLVFLLSQNVVQFCVQGRNGITDISMGFFQVIPTL
jgi:hypothetical protein